MTNQVETALGVFDLDAKTFSGTGPADGIAGALPDVTLASIIKTGINSYFASSWCVARAQDIQRNAWVERERANGHPDAKKADCPDEAYKSGSPGYEEAVVKAKRRLAEMFLEGYEAGVRGGEGAADTLPERVAREWLHGFAAARQFYVAPSKKSNYVAKDDDELTPKGKSALRSETFGDALEIFKSLDRPAAEFVLKSGFPCAQWGIKPRKDETVPEFIAREADRRKAAKANKPEAEEGGGF